MPLIGNQLASAENNSFRVLDDISNFTLVFDGSSISNVSTTNDTITLFQHPFVTGQRVTYRSGGGSPIGGLISGTAYYINKVDTNTFKLSTTYAGSLQNTNLIDITSTGTGVTHSFNVAFDGINTKFKATYNNGTKCSISRAAQLDIAVNGVVQQPYDSNPPPNGFTIEADATIVFSTAPLAGFTFWGKALTNAIASFETSDNSIDTFTGNGTQKNFTLSKTPANSQNVLVTINGVLQYPSDASSTRSYSVNANILAFDTAPSNGSVIQVRYIGFAGATSSSVTGFYGRTGNVILTRSDNIAIGTAKIGPVAGVSTTLLVEGNARITGILTIGTSSITFDGNNDRITVGPSFIGATGVGLGTTSTTGRNSGVGTAAGTLIFNSDTASVQVYNGNAWRDVGKEVINATGGLVNEYVQGGRVYRSHIFTSSGFFTVPSAPPSATVDYLVVGGGGGGGCNHGGGGGAGGFRTGSGIPISSTPGVYTITVGAGGNGGTPVASPPSAAPAGSDGGASTFSTITSAGGGGGGARNDANTNSPGRPGGSGGGGGGATGSQAGNRTAGTGNTPPVSPPQGNPGGVGVDLCGGGGGGASQAGVAGPGSGGGAGGAGASSSITGITTSYAGGGGGGTAGVPSPGGVGGDGGGGTGGTGSFPIVNNTFGTVATGGGGGGGNGGFGPGASGGSGIVVVRYEIGQVGGTAKATGGAISYTPTTTIHTFYSSGVFTVTNPALTSVSMLMVGGGGGGGGKYHSGGGGAGGLLYTSSLPISVTSYPVVIGSGGAGGFSPTAGPGNGGYNGANTSAFGLNAVGGGGGGAYVPGSVPGSSGLPGGSGGGGGTSSPPSSPSGGSATQTSPTGVQGYGNPGGGGFHFTPYAFGGGGGGAGEAGYIGGPGTPGGALRQGGGGNGLAFTISGTSQYYAGGGGGSLYHAAVGNNPQGANFRTQGGLGGGGRGGTESATLSVATGESGVINTGGGGGGSERNIPDSGNPQGGFGGSGIVIIAYPS